MESVIELSVKRLSEAYEKALTMSVDEEKVRDFDPLWMDIWLDQWNRMPEKIRAASLYGHIHIHVYWDQYFRMFVYPKNKFPSLPELLSYFRYALDNPDMDWIFNRLFPKHLSLQENLNWQRELWKTFLQEKKTIETEGAVYIDIADLLQDQSPFIWSGHWMFDGVVLDRYRDGEIDFNSYYGSHFHTEENLERFEKFHKQMQLIGMNREKIWTLFTPSGERVWKTVAVMSMDGNSNRLLLEGENEFLDVHSFGS